jgi:hypothetical protein
MPEVRRIGAELMLEGVLVCTQKGIPADPLCTRGAIRFKGLR